jgi:hypothetical protein
LPAGEVSLSGVFRPAEAVVSSSEPPSLPPHLGFWG